MLRIPACRDLFLSLPNIFELQPKAGKMLPQPGHPESKMYFIALVLPPGLNEKILKFKNHMQELYGCQVALKSPAHITLIPPFWMEGSREQQLLGDLEIFSASRKSFNLATAHFSAFRPKTIFIATSASPELEQLKRACDEYFTSKPGYPLKIDNRPFHPHITIATRDPFKKDFYAAWDHFKEKLFEEQWTVEGISVLRHNKKNWDVIFTSQLQ